MSTAIRLYLNEQTETIKTKRALALGGFLKAHNISLSDTIDEIYSFLTELNENDQPESPYIVEKLRLQSNQIRDLPVSFLKIARNLTYLDLHDNDLTALWPLEGTCPRLEMVDLSSNRFEVFPNQLLLLEDLRVLSLENNSLKYLPPSVGELPHLHHIELANNPLVLPPIEMILAIQSQGSELDWIHKLKAYLVANSSAITAKIDEQVNDSLKKPSDSVAQMPFASASYSAVKSRPVIMRSKSVSEKSRVSAASSSSSSKASRRMGLVLKKSLPDDSLDLGSSASIQNASFYFDDSHNDLKPVVLSASAAELTFNVASTPSVGTSTSTTANPGVPAVSNSTNSSPSSSYTALPHSGSYTSLTTPIINRPNSRNRSRSNTLREIDRILDKQEITDIEQKSGAYFRRLSTLQELPQDELLMHPGVYQSSNTLFASMSSLSAVSTMSSIQTPMTVSPAITLTHPHVTVTSGAAHSAPVIHGARLHSLGHLNHQVKYKDQHTQNSAGTIPTPATSASTGSAVASHDSSPVVLAKGGNTFEISPIKNQFTSNQHSNGNGTTSVSKKLRDPSLTLRVSRKILFSFMELQSSIRRFIGFCVDKKLTLKMVQFLYSNKSIQDSLVENLEQMEDQGNNHDQVLQSLQMSIAQFKQIMELLGDNLPSFVMKTDVCFIRLMYLSLFGAFNELYNGYRALVPHHKPPVFNLSSQFQLSTGGSTFALDSKQKPTHVAESEDVDERLYRAIENSINSAQVVFGELTSALHKNPLPSPPVTGGSIPESLAGTPGGGSAAAGNNSKMRELNAVCLTSMDITKRLKTNLATIRNNPSSSAKRLFWDDVNLFLKSIIQFFSSVKPIMKEGSAFYEIRPSMAVLTKHTKDVTVLLEVSSYKTMSSETNVGPVSSTGLGPTPLSAVHSQINVLTPIVTSHPLQQSYPSAVNLGSMNGGNSGPPPAARTPLVAGMQSMLLLQLSAEPVGSPAFTSPNSVTNMPVQSTQ